MKLFIATAYRIYTRNFFYFLKILSPLLISIIALRLFSQYSNLGALDLIFSTVFGIILVVIGILIEIILIKATYQLIASNSQTAIAKSLKQLFWEASEKFFMYLTLTIATGVIIFSVPIILKPLKNILDNPYAVLGAQSVMYAWIISCSSLFLFSSYLLIIEQENIKSAIVKSIKLFLTQPFQLALNFICSAAFFGAVLILLATLTSIVIAIFTGEIALVFDPYFSPWWQKMIIDLYALLGLPALILVSSLLYESAKQKHLSLIQQIPKSTENTPSTI